MNRFVFQSLLLLMSGTLACTLLSAQANKYAGSMKKIVGVKYTDSRNITGLRGWQFREGTLATVLDDPQPIMVEVYKKGSTYIVFFSVMEDTASKEYVIADLVELKNVTKNQEVKTAVCRAYKQGNAFIVALTNTGRTHYFKAIKAWLFDRDRIRFEMINAKTVECLNEGDDD